MRTPAQRAWFYCQRLYDGRWSTFRWWKLLRFLATSHEAAAIAWGEVEAALLCYHEHRRSMSRHAWSTMVMLALRDSLAGCEPCPDRLAILPPENIPGTSNQEAFDARCYPQKTGDPAFDARAGVLYLQQMNVCGFTQPYLRHGRL